MDPKAKNTYLIAGAAFVVLVVAIFFLFIFQRAPKGPQAEDSAEEVKELSEVDIAKRPYVTLTPTTDGAEIIMSMENMSFCDKIEYELTYLADNPLLQGEKIERGSTGTDINAQESKYKKSILLGTGSRGVRSPDTGIEGGKLTLHCYKASVEYQSETEWNLMKDGAKKTKVIDSAASLEVDIPALGKDHWIIVSNTVGIPANFEFDAKNVLLPAYSVSSVDVEKAGNGSLVWKLQSEVEAAELYVYSNGKAKWQKVESKFDQSAKTITATVSPFSTFVAVSN